MIGTGGDEIPFSKVPELHRLKLDYEATNIRPEKDHIIFFIIPMYYHVPSHVSRQPSDLFQLNSLPRHPTSNTIITNLPLPHAETKAS